MNNLKIIINIFYQPSNILIKYLIDNPIYFPINGGSSLKLKNYDWLTYDNTGKDNISNLNYLINEMTSIYWFWKNYNLNNLSYVGFNHYRRFFLFNEFYDYKNYDILASQPFKFYKKINLYEQYKLFHNINDMNKLIEIIDQLYPDNQFKSYLNNYDFNYICNMFIMKKDLFIEYCEFIFPILKKLINVINIANRDSYQRRAIAFLSERLTSYWISQKKINGFKIKELKIHKIDKKI